MISFLICLLTLSSITCFSFTIFIFLTGSVSLLFDIVLVYLFLSFFLDDILYIVGSVVGNFSNDKDEDLFEKILSSHTLASLYFIFPDESIYFNLYGLQYFEDDDESLDLLFPDEREKRD